MLKKTWIVGLLLVLNTAAVIGAVIGSWDLSGWWGIQYSKASGVLGPSTYHSAAVMSASSLGCLALLNVFGTIIFAAWIKTLPAVVLVGIALVAFLAFCLITP